MGNEEMRTIFNTAVVTNVARGCQLVAALGEGGVLLLGVHRHVVAGSHAVPGPTTLERVVFEFGGGLQVRLLDGGGECSQRSRFVDIEDELHAMNRPGPAALVREPESLTLLFDSAVTQWRDARPGQEVALCEILQVVSRHVRRHGQVGGGEVGDGRCEPSTEARQLGCNHCRRCGILVLSQTAYVNGQNCNLLFEYVSNCKAHTIVYLGLK